MIRYEWLGNAGFGTVELNKAGLDHAEFSQLGLHYEW